MDKNQSLTFELLIILGVVLVLISPVGQWLASIVEEIATSHKFNLSFNPFDKGPSQVASNAPASQSSSHTSSYTVDLAGGGQMTVNANSPQAARDNVVAQGGTPA